MTGIQSIIRMKLKVNNGWLMAQLCQNVDEYDNGDDVTLAI